MKTISKKEIKGYITIAKKTQNPEVFMMAILCRLHKEGFDTKNFFDAIDEEPTLDKEKISRVLKW